MRIGDQYDDQQQCIQCRFVEERRLMPLPEFLYVNIIRKELEIWICDQISVSLLIHKIPPTPDGLSKNKAGNQRICKRPEGKFFDLAVNQYNSNTAEDASINGKPALIDLKNGEKVILVLLPLKKHIVCSGTENTHENHPIYGYLKDRRTSSAGLSTRKLPPLCAASSAWSLTARACIRSRIFCPRKRFFVRLPTLLQKAWVTVETASLKTPNAGGVRR